MKRKTKEPPTATVGSQVLSREDRKIIEEILADEIDLYLHAMRSKIEQSPLLQENSPRQVQRIVFYFDGTVPAIKITKKRVPRQKERGQNE